MTKHRQETATDDESTSAKAEEGIWPERADLSDLPGWMRVHYDPTYEFYVGSPYHQKFAEGYKRLHPDRRERTLMNRS